MSNPTVSFLWCPLWANTGPSGKVTLFAWGGNDSIDYDGATDTIRVVHNAVTRATSAALTFARETLHRIRVDYGSFGTKLSVDGVETTNASRCGSTSSRQRCRPSSHQLGGRSAAPG